LFKWLKLKHCLWEGSWFYPVTIKYVQKNTGHSVKAHLVGKYHQGKGGRKREHLKLTEMGGMFGNISEYYLVFYKFIFD